MKVREENQTTLCVTGEQCVCDTVLSSSVVQLPSCSVGDFGIFTSPVCSRPSSLTLNQTFRSSDYIVSSQSCTCSSVLLSASCQLEDDNLNKSL